MYTVMSHKKGFGKHGKATFTIKKNKEKLAHLGNFLGLKVLIISQRGL